jgi:hypothetical protein
VPCLKLLLAAHVRFVVEELALGQILLRVLQGSSVNIISPTSIHKSQQSENETTSWMICGNISGYLEVICKISVNAQIHESLIQLHK